MKAGPETEPIIQGRGLHKTFRRGTEIVRALIDVSLEVLPGTLASLVGPDGAGKTTLLRLLAGLFSPDSGELRMLQEDVVAHPQRIQAQIGYMPQKFGLYEDLTVQENLDLYADLHGVTDQKRREKYQQLLDLTALAPFTGRLARQLSGGMKQKLGLACTLICSPPLLLLDEPTVGVDPVSRRELWEILHHLIKNEQLTVLVSTAYLDEAEQCAQAVVMHQGRVLQHGPPGDVRQLAEGRTFLVEPPAGQPARSFQAKILDKPEIIDAVPEAGQVRFVRDQSDSEAASSQQMEGQQAAPVAARFEDGFMVLIHRFAPAAHDVTWNARVRTSQNGNGKPIVRVQDLVRKFGSFTAVDRVSFEVKAGEVFGLLGSNGAGKTTTFRMLCGLLAPTSGTLEVAGADIGRAGASARQRLGYVAQKFSLYGQLSVRENLEFFASAYSLRGKRRSERIRWALEQFELEGHERIPSGQLPGGYKQRLAMAAALLHEPDVLFLDEPTSGADPLARREFWRRITTLAEQGVTIIVTTHFMEEAEYCDQIVILDSGKELARGTPAEVRHKAPAVGGKQPTLNDAFIAIVEQARQKSFGQ